MEDDLAEKLAKNVLDNLMGNFVREHDMRVVDGAAYRHVSQRYYRKVGRELEELGFRHLGDVEDRTVAEGPGPDPRTFIRLYLSPDQTSIAAIYHIAPTWLWRVAIFLMRVRTKVLEFESVTDSGAHIGTSTCSQIAETPSPETIRYEFVRAKMTPAALHERHLDRVRDHNEQLIRVANLDEAIALQQHQNRLKHDHLESIGWVTREYLKGQAVGASNLEAVYEAAQRLVKNGYTPEGLSTRSS